jgi:UDP-N-acetylmuramate: L-alanyl-gamma-D-glutamyl-meso-diaminopimelate ligase
MKIHMLGIGGTGMGSLAGLLTEAGHTVTGTDEEIYPPMSDQLEALGIVPFKGYSAENLGRASPDLAIIGNVIRKENPEAQEIMRRDIPYRSMPSAISELFLRDKTPLVITGTHGKTTSATLASWLLKQAGEEPGFLVGGVGKNLGRSYDVGKGPIFVIEGDEYDSAFFDKGPKFLHYKPQALIITSIEFDHADIYADVEQINAAFRRLVPLVPPDGIIVMNAEDERVMALRRLARARIVTYGIDRSADYRPEDVIVDENGTGFALKKPNRRFTLPMWGRHNLLNCTGVLAALLESGINADKLAGGLISFEGITRRQELRAVINGVSVIDDFAHHPTAVATTIDSMRLRFPEGRIWAIFEPRSNTSRRNIFQKEYTRALAHADRVIVASPFKSEAIPADDRFDSKAVADAIMRSGKDSHHIDETEHIVEFIMRGVEPDDVLLVMSNGGFDGLIEKLMDALKGRRTFSGSDEIPYSRVRK